MNNNIAFGFHAKEEPGNCYACDKVIYLALSVDYRPFRDTFHRITNIPLSGVVKFCTACEMSLLDISLFRDRALSVQRVREKRENESTPIVTIAVFNGLRDHRVIRQRFPQGLTLSNILAAQKIVLPPGTFVRSVKYSNQIFNYAIFIGFEYIILPIDELKQIVDSFASTIDFGDNAGTSNTSPVSELIFDENFITNELGLLVNQMYESPCDSIENHFEDYPENHLEDNSGDFPPSLGEFGPAFSHNELKFDSSPSESTKPKAQNELYISPTSPASNSTEKLSSPINIQPTKYKESPQMTQLNDSFEQSDPLDKYSSFETSTTSVQMDSSVASGDGSDEVADADEEPSTSSSMSSLIAETEPAEENFGIETKKNGELKAFKVSEKEKMAQRLETIQRIRHYTRNVNPSFSTSDVENQVKIQPKPQPRTQTRRSCMSRRNTQHRVL